MKKFSIWLPLTLWFLSMAAVLPAYEGGIVDSTTGKPIEGASVTLADHVVRTDNNGLFRIEGAGEVLRVRAPGYARRDVPTSEIEEEKAVLKLTPFKVKGLYLTVYGIGSRVLREAALESIRENQLNALVIDVKGDRGLIPFKIDLPLADEIGAQKVITVKEMKPLMDSLRKKGIYLIARIVVFKDDPLAAAKPELAVKVTGKAKGKGRGKAGGKTVAKAGDGVFRDREKLRWVDPFRKEVWDYNIAIAKIAAQTGFDEIQFDYVRFPDANGVAFSQPTNEESRTGAITGFLEAARKALVPYNVMLSADVFGYVPWNTNDTHIGQKIAPILDVVDVVSLMLYPSGFHLGIPDYRNPVAHPYEIVHLTLKNAGKRTQVSPLRFRPWLQAFRDYAFSRKVFGKEEMQVQIKAADDFGTSGWMFWNASNVYPKNFIQ
jgi:hypothetical protein